MSGRTLYDKIWDDHVVEVSDSGTALLYIDRHLVHEVTSPQAFEGLRLAGRTVRAPDRTRHMLTLRLTKLAMNQNLTLSAFSFWSPNESDGHLRLRASYKLSDAWLVEGGGNFFYGPHDDVFFSQLNDNTNIYFALRRSF